jgi:hypothetical protein
MIMRLKRRGGGPEEMKDIATFQEEGRGVRVFDVNGHDLGYFGPEEYGTIIVGAAAGKPAQEGEPNPDESDW